MSEHIRGASYRQGCRCSSCVARCRFDRWQQRQRNLALTQDAAARGETRVVDGTNHGIAGYRNKHCRCEVCRAANKAACAAYRQRRKAMADA